MWKLKGFLELPLLVILYSLQSFLSSLSKNIDELAVTQESRIHDREEKSVTLSWLVGEKVTVGQPVWEMCWAWVIPTLVICWFLLFFPGMKHWGRDDNNIADWLTFRTQVINVLWLSTTIHVQTICVHSATVTQRFITRFSGCAKSIHCKTVILYSLVLIRLDQFKMWKNDYRMTQSTAHNI